MKTPPLLAALLVCSTSLLANDPLAQGFVNPPDSAKPQTWWHWMNGNISKEGITADLEAMKRVGIGGAKIFNVGCGIPKGPVEVIGDEWLEFNRHAFAEAERLGLEIGVHNCAGWSSSGGPWNTPANAMQYVVTSEVAVQGPKHVSLVLPEPGKRLDYYRDIAVLAFKSPKGESVRLRELAPKVTASATSLNASKIMDGNLGTYSSLPLAKVGKSAFVQFEFEKPFTAQTLTVAGELGCAAEIEVSEDRKNFKVIRSIASLRKIGRMELGDYNSFTFAPTKARFFRVQFKPPFVRMQSVVLREIELSPRLGVENLQAKAAYYRTDKIEPAAEAFSPEFVIPRGKIIDLTEKMGAHGKLDWDVPEGDWTILRIGHTPTGRSNQPAPKNASGPSGIPTAGPSRKCRCMSPLATGAPKCRYASIRPARCSSFSANRLATGSGWSL